MAESLANLIVILSTCVIFFIVLHKYIDENDW